MPGDGVEWRTVANYVLAALVAVGGYVWNGTLSQLHDMQKDAAIRNERLSAMDAQWVAQLNINADLRDRMQRIELKIDRLQAGQVRQLSERR